MARNNGRSGRTELTPWIDPELLDYKPTDRQSAFRRCVRNCVLNGKYLKADWYRASARSEAEAFKGHPVAPSEFKKWSQKKGFMVWFFEDFPEADPITEQELRMIEHKWWRGVLDAMDEGVAARMGEQQRAENKELSDFLGSGSEGGAWHANAPEA